MPFCGEILTSDFIEFGLMMRNRVVTKRHDLKITDFRENPGGNKPGLGVQLGSKVKRVQLNKGRLYAINYDQNL